MRRKTKIKPAARVLTKGGKQNKREKNNANDQAVVYCESVTT